MLEVSGEVVELPEASRLRQADVPLFVPAVGMIGTIGGRSAVDADRVFEMLPRPVWAPDVVVRWGMGGGAWAVLHGRWGVGGAASADRRGRSAGLAGEGVAGSAR
ncbi:hypothetical protein [Sinosporangium album]|uniref:hypothetical protein n=1 Tax=Sinosporangium album TaxID=504805 RepID=UPI000B826822|nr:hypothetical protein [Sinosporangium album]